MIKPVAISPVVMSMGDPSGVGPEIIIALLKARASDDILVVGDGNLLEGIARIADISQYRAGIACLHRPCTTPAIAGAENLANAQCTIDWLEEAIALVRDKRAKSLVTAPINKDILFRGAGFSEPGHTEFLAKIDGIKTPVMMLSSDDLRVVPVTIHIALADVPTMLTPELLRETITITNSSLINLGIAAPRIAVAGLNPHAGENGRMGQEELDWIAPLLANMRAEGLNIKGPLPADTMFHKHARASYDVAICMYHDQALIPIKTLAFDRGVNVTLGLSFLRTSPDHGTAYDIAGKGMASATSMIAAYDYAKKWAF